MPQKTGEVYLTVIFKYGYYNDKDKSYGIIHLLEHILGTNIEKKFRTNYLGASVGDLYTGFNIETSKKNIEVDAVNLLKIILESEVDNKKLLKKEKARIQIELYEKFINFHTKIKEKIKSILIKSPESVKTERYEQIKNINRATSKNLENIRRKMIARHPYIFIEGYRFNTKEKQKIKRLMKKYTRTRDFKKTDKQSKRIVYKKPNKKSFTHPLIDSKYVHKSIIFPAYSIQNSEIFERIALGFICKELRKKLTESIEKIGVYRIDCDYSIKSGYGYVRFYSFIYKKHIDEYKKIIYSEIENLSNDKNLPKKIKKYISNRKRDFRENWKKNEPRRAWIIDDVLDFGQVQDLNKLNKELEKITPEIIKKIIEKIFNKNKEYVMLIEAKK